MILAASYILYARYASILFCTMHNRVGADTLVAVVSSLHRNRGDSGAHEATRGEEQIFDEEMATH